MLRRLATILTLLAIAGLARLAAWPVGSFDGAVRTVVIEGGEGRKLAASVYEPAAAPSGPTRQAVVLCHGVHASRRHMDPMARALARRGHLVVSFDYGGEGDSESRSQTEEANIADVRAGIALARRSGAGGPIALVGHSMGVTSAVGAALADPTVVCVVALGQRPFATPERPRALLVAAGAMDAFHPYGALVNAASESAGRPVTPFATCVDRQTGAVRRVTFAATCEHAGEVFDGVVLGDTVGFIEAAFADASRHVEVAPAGAPPIDEAAYAEAPFLPRPPLEATLLFVARVALGAAVALLGLLLASAVGLAPEGGAQGIGGASGLARRLLSAALLLLALAPLLGTRAGVLPLELARDAAPALLGGVALANAAVRRRALGARIDARSSVATGFAIYAGWIGGTMLGALPALEAHPELSAGLPVYLWQGVALRVHYWLETLATTLVPASLAMPLALPAAPAAPDAGGGTAAVASLLGAAPWTLTAIVLVEVVAPGRALGFMINLALRMVRAIGGPVTVPEASAPSASGAAGKGAQPGVAGAIGAARVRLAAILLGLLVVAGALFWKRAGEGLLSGEGALGTVALAGLRLLVLPAVAAWVGVLGLKLVEKVRGRPIGGG